MRSRSIFGAIMLGTLMMSQSASALSCARPNLVEVLEEVKASPNLYYVLSGQFEAQTAEAPRRGGYTPSQGMAPTGGQQMTPTQFRGVSLQSAPEADQALDGLAVNVQTSCAGPWCSGVPAPTKSVIAFVEAQEGGTPVLKVGACPKFIFPATAENVDTVRVCLEKTCDPIPRRRR